MGGREKEILAGLSLLGYLLGYASTLTPGECEGGLGACVEMRHSYFALSKVLKFYEQKSGCNMMDLLISKCHLGEVAHILYVQTKHKTCKRWAVARDAEHLCISMMSMGATGTLNSVIFTNSLCFLCLLLSRAVAFHWRLKAFMLYVLI